MNTHRRFQLLKAVLSSLVLFSSLMILSGCSTRNATRDPQFYPNEHLTKVGAGQANNDTRYCMSLADEYVTDQGRFRESAKNVGTTAVAGAAAGAVSSTIIRGGNAGRFTAAGAATGAIIQLVNELIQSGQPNPTWERFVEQCLDNKGYRVYSWR